MINKPVIMVAGLGRCGSSLTMQMLHAARIRCAGSYPDFEADEANHRPIDRDWLMSWRGGAVKWINPHLAPAPKDVPLVVIWLMRDYGEQASSQIKFALTTIPVLAKLGSPNNRLWAKSLVRDTTRAWTVIRRYPVRLVSFEMLLRFPTRVTGELAHWLSHHGFEGLDTARMASVVQPRGPECQPDLSIERRLLEGAA